MTATPSPRDAGSTSHNRLHVRVQLLLAAVLAALLLIVGVSLWLLRAEALSEGQRRTENLAHILGDHLALTVSAVDTALTQLALHSRRVGGPTAESSAWMPVLESLQANMAGIGSFTVTDVEGKIVHSTVTTVVGQSRADQFLFRELAANEAAAMVADTPFRSVRSGHMLIPLGRRLTTPDGQFAGIVVATLEPALLRDFYRSVDVGRSGLVWVLHPDGRVVFREPSLADPIGEPARDNPLILRARTEPRGDLRGSFTPDGPVYLSAYRHIAQPALVVAVSLAERDVLAAWRRQAAVAGSIMVSIACLLILAALHLGREIRARVDAEERASAHAGELATALVERDQANAELRASQVRFQAIMDHTPLLVFVRDLDGRYTFVNRAAQQWLAATSRPEIGKRLQDIMSSEAAQKADDVNRQVISTKAPIQHEWTLDTPIGKRTLLSTKFPLVDDAGNIWGLGVISTDITDQKHAEAQLAHAQRMEAVGQLTGGIAHDFNNMLTAILLNADVLASQIQSDTLRPLAEAMRAAAERGADLTRRLLAFGRRQTLVPRATDVNELLFGMEPLMQRTLGEHIDIRFQRGEGVWAATVDAAQLENAIVNLAVNARDAMPEGGRLTIETANVELDGDFAKVNPDVRPGQYVMIAVSDTGLGMPADVVAHAFEPFYTTKDVGKGTGLGLSMVYGFVKQSGGHVRIYSEVGIGTTVRLYLPRAERDAACAVAPPPSPRELAGGHETILLVEDDPLVRAHTETQLRALGYEVVTAEHAKAAIDLVDRGCTPDLLFTDMVMPGGLNGQELALRLRQRWPDLRVLYTSGYAHGAFDSAGQDPAGGAPMLAKPFRRRDLAAKVREVLDAPVAAAS
jgi:PAS domain S-box-containing protein